ncbi:hypothetical protein [Micromonospora sp. NPDC049102]|uniref:hypothetical protein n=1 Tax=Micromonospora sp. NPDC049102 TaxID=3364265 RepID=UPI0037140A0E
MLKWEYALLVRRRQAATNDLGWEVVFVWYGPDGSMVDVTPYGDTARPKPADPPPRQRMRGGRRTLSG